MFQDRIDAGRRLSPLLKEYAGRDDAVILALPRGGVPVAFEISRALSAPLDIFMVRKLGLPGKEELAMGAIASGGVRILNEDVIESYRVSPAQIEGVSLRESREMERREQLYRGDRTPLDVRGRTIILVDDGLATGFTMRAAIRALRQKAPRQIVAAVPVAAPSSFEELDALADRGVCLFTPFDFYSVGQWYRDFSQTTDHQVHDLLGGSVQHSSKSAA